MQEFLTKFLGYKGLKWVLSSVTLYFFLKGFYLEYLCVQEKELVAQISLSTRLLNNTLTIIASSIGAIYSHVKAKDTDSK